MPLPSTSTALTTPATLAAASLRPAAIAAVPTHLSCLSRADGEKARVELAAVPIMLLLYLLLALDGAPNAKTKANDAACAVMGLDKNALKYGRDYVDRTGKCISNTGLGA